MTTYHYIYIYSLSLAPRMFIHRPNLLSQVDLSPRILPLSTTNPAYNAIKVRLVEGHARIGI